MLRHFVQGLCTRTSGRVLVAGTIGVLAGFERLLRPRTMGTHLPERFEPGIGPLRRESRAIAQPVRERSDYFQIRRTVSELGYRYWVVQGFGKFSSFALLDTWEEARDEAIRRLQEEIAPETFSTAVLAR